MLIPYEYAVLRTILVDDVQNLTPDAPPSALEMLLVLLRYKDGRRIAAGGNKPFLLSDPDAVWLVESGSVNVFAVSAENNEAVGSRHYLFRTDANQMLLGMALEGRNI